MHNLEVLQAAMADEVDDVGDRLVAQPLEDVGLAGMGAGERREPLDLPGLDAGVEHRP